MLARCTLFIPSLTQELTGINLDNKHVICHPCLPPLPVPLDFCDIIQPTNTEAVVLPVECPGNAPANTGFPHTRGSNQAQNFALGATPQPADSNEFQNALFDIIQPVMILI